MSHSLKYTTIVPAATPLGESTFADARRQLQARHGVVPVEVFLDGIQSEGRIQAGDLTIDLSVLSLRVITFGAEPASITPADAHEDEHDVEPVGSTTTTSA